MERLTTRLNRISYELSYTERLLEVAAQVSGTKAEKRKFADNARKIISEKAKECDKYRNAFDPFVVGDKDNSVADELRQIKEDIGTALFLNAKGETEAVDKLLYEIKERL